MEWQQSTWKRPIRTDLAQQSTDLAPQIQNLSAKKYVIRFIIPVNGKKRNCFQGDSGGPLMQVGKYENEFLWEAIGIVSFGYGCKDIHEENVRKEKL